MKMMDRDMTSFIGPEHTDLLDLLEVRMSDIDGRDSGDDCPVLTPLLV
jgi:hypothetical protein